MRIREIEEKDNYIIAEVIKQVLIEFHADPKTTFLGDPAINTMYYNYQSPKSVYFIVEENDVVLGGCGINRLDEGDSGICELQRMFLLPAARGKGYGKLLMDACISKAMEFGFDEIYLESLTQMIGAIKLYERSGFQYIDNPKGNTGHGGCNVFMVLDLKKKKEQGA